jgi:hypothetical protein
LGGNDGHADSNDKLPLRHALQCAILKEANPS